MKTRRRTVADVMTMRVHIATPTTPFKLLVRLIEENRISAVPIVDQWGFPIGLVSESDLLLKERRIHRDSETDLRNVRRRTAVGANVDGLVAADVMTSPPITIPAHKFLVDAVRLMQERNMRRLVVVDDSGKIAGIVSRSDLLKVFLRSDEQLLKEIVEGLLPTLMLGSESIGVRVRYNVVTLEGEVDRKSEVEILVRRTRELDGVVDVVNRLTYRWDDTAKSAAGAW